MIHYFIDIVYSEAVTSDQATYFDDGNLWLEAGR